MNGHIAICLNCKRLTCSGGDGICDYTRNYGRSDFRPLRQHSCGVKQVDNGIEFAEIHRAINRAAEKMGLNNKRFGEL